MSRFKRTLNIGIGGAGLRAIDLLKKKLIGDCKDETFPRQVAFLAIDTNRRDLENLENITHEERLCLSVREPFERYQREINSSTYEYIPKQNVSRLLALDRGAGQIRSNGHFAAIEGQYLGEIVRRLKNIATDIRSITVENDKLLKDSKIQVNIIFSIAGGTGSGLFLPIALLVREAIKDSEITGYIYSPSFHERIVENSAKEVVVQNAYAALLELDYCMHLGYKGYDPITFSFGSSESQKIVMKRRPFDEVMYIDNKTFISKNGDVEHTLIEKEDAARMITDLLKFSSTDIMSNHVGVMDNVRQKVAEGRFDVRDKFGWMMGFGMSEIYCTEDENKEDIAIVNLSNYIENKLKDLSGDDKSKIEKEAFEKLDNCFLNETGSKNFPIDDYNTDYSKDGDSLKKYLKWEGEKQSLPETMKGDKIKLEEFYKNQKEEKNNDPEYTKKVEEFKKDSKEKLYELINKAYREHNIFYAKHMLDCLVRFVNKSVDTLDKELKKNNFDSEKGKLDKNFKENREDIDKAQPKGLLQFSNVQRVNFQKYKKSKLNQLESLAVSYKDKSFEEDLLNDCKTFLGEIKNYLNVLKESIELLEQNLKNIKDRVESEADDANKRKSSIHNKILHRVKIDYPKYSDCYTGRIELNELIGFCNSNFYESLKEKFIDGIKIKSLLEILKKYQNSEEINSEFTGKELEKIIEEFVKCSTPLMGVDKHGESFTVDEFVYLVGDFASDNEDRKLSGDLLRNELQKLFPTLKISKVHANGMEHRAILYRINGAVPPYFVSGIAGENDPIALESIYEIAKTRKFTYTPFSHEILRKKLENRISFLKPIDPVETYAYIEYWVNFLILDYIQYQKMSKSIESYSKDSYVYCIKSEQYGDYLIDDVTCDTKVLILGDTRTDAYETFRRYCGALLKEYPEYKQSIEKVKIGEKEENICKISKCDYIENENWCKYKHEDIKKLTRDNPDYMLFKKEFDFIEQRYENYNKKEDAKKFYEDLSKCIDCDEK